MDENLIISENNPEAVHMFTGGELYLVEESQWYSEIKSEGHNKYRFLNIVSHPADACIPSENRDFFFRMINAIQTDKFNMDSDGFAVVNVNSYKGLKWKNLEQIFSPKYVIFWGVDPAKMNIPCRLYGTAVLDNCRIMYVNSLDIISEDLEQKKQLWNLIKRMFEFGNR